jgi:hypothetical protein
MSVVTDVSLYRTDTTTTAKIEIDNRWFLL